MFHLRNGFHFSRNDNDGGMIKITVKKEPYTMEAETLIEIQVKPCEFASVMAHVSKRGGTGETVKEAEEFLTKE